MDIMNRDSAYLYTKRSSRKLEKMILRRGELFIGITPNFLFFFHPQKTGNFYSGHLFTCGEASALRKRFCYYHFMLRFGLFIYKEIQP